MRDRIHLKICGMRDAENILSVAELQPDYMGFIFYPTSKRFVGSQFEIPELLPKSIKRVGVFVNEMTKEILRLTNNHDLDFIQLHGGESVRQCAALKENGLGVIKVFSVDNHFDFKEVKPYKGTIDYVLFDTKSEYYGGTGRTFDWNSINKYDQQIPFFLSGGLNATNLEKTNDLVNMNLHALDINSGVEISPGVKSVDKIVEFKNILKHNIDRQ